MNNLHKEIEKEIEKRIDDIINNIIFPEFQKIARHYVKKNYYDLYSPTRYKRKWRLLSEWDISKNNKDYEIYIKKDVMGEWKGNLYYLPQLITEGKVLRKENNQYTYTPRPFISNLKINLNKDQLFKTLLKKHNLILK